MIFVHRGHQVAGLFAVFLGDGDLFGRRGELLERTIARALPQGARAAGKQEALAAVLLVDLVFVGQIVADRW